MTHSSQRGQRARTTRPTGSVAADGPVVTRRLRTLDPPAAGRRRRRRRRQLFHVHMLEPFGTDHGAV